MSNSVTPSIGSYRAGAACYSPKVPQMSSDVVHRNLGSLNTYSWQDSISFSLTRLQLAQPAMYGSRAVLTGGLKPKGEMIPNSDHLFVHTRKGEYILVGYKDVRPPTDAEFNKHFGFYKERPPKIISHYKKNLVNLSEEESSVVISFDYTDKQLQKLRGVICDQDICL